MDEYSCKRHEPLCCRMLSSSCAVGTGIMKDPSRPGAAVALLVVLHALCSVELTGKFRALPDARPILTMIKLTLVAVLSTSVTGCVMRSIAVYPRKFYMPANHHLPGCGLQTELPPSAAWESGARGLLFRRLHERCM